MNSTPDPRSTSEGVPPKSTPFDAPPTQASTQSEDLAPTQSENLAPAQSAEQTRVAEQAALEAKMALLPDYDDEPFPRRSGRAAASKTSGGSQEGLAEGASRGFGLGVEGEDVVQAPGSVLAGGCLGGILGNAVLGFVLLGLQRAGVALYGPGVLAIVVALVALALLAGSWPRRVWLAAAGFLLGLIFSFGILFLFVRPALDAVKDGRLPASASPQDEAPPASAEGLQPS